MHQIVFRDVSNDWHNALPVGNGKTGAMVFFQNGILHIAFNNYDCYYQILPRHLSGDQANGTKRRTFDDPARAVQTYEELCRSVDAAKKNDDYQRAHYLKILHPETESSRPSYQGSSYPMGGEILIHLDGRVDVSHSSLKLVIEEGKIRFSAGTGECRARAELFIPKTGDGMIIEMAQTENGLWKNAEVVAPSRRGQGRYESQVQVKECMICLTAAYPSDRTEEETSLVQELSFYLPSAAGLDQLEQCLYFPEGGRRFRAFAALLPGRGQAASLCRSLEVAEETFEEEHGAAWKKFWTSSVKLPDYFLETLWHLHVYLMECSSGRGSAYPEQACGLSGLWDIRRPNMWGSMWYWDANIQTAFAGTYSAGHPEITKVFCDGYLSYEEEIRAYTRHVYGRDGWALDYPHPLYNCIQPWCAQFLWLYYQYSGDQEFLGKKAYPVFCEQIRFFQWLAKKDEGGVLHIGPDISPEQGTIGSDSVITTACIRKLVQAAIQAAVVLERPEDEIAGLKEVFTSLPAYSLTADGKRWKDSAADGDHVFLRHPLVMVPVFQTEEITWESGREVRTVAEETLRDAAEHTEIGTFGPGWLSMSAAVLKKGASAQRILYEKLLDYVLHSNGMGYEESERFINYCHITKPAHYLPPMNEVSGCIVNTVNLMLLQSGGGVHVFPAVPDGEDGLLEKYTQYREDDKEMAGSYPDWQEAEFSGLLAPGGFLVSAQRKGGRTTYIRVRSTSHAVLKLYVPAELSRNGVEALFEKEMEAGEEVIFGKRVESEIRSVSEILCHTAARTHRRIFVGEDKDTSFYKAIDSFVCAYGFGNDYRYCSTPYVFDFGRTDVRKNYDSVYPRQIYFTGKSLLYAAGPINAGIKAYDSDRGWGFTEITGIGVKDRKGPDDLRRDFLEGDALAEFKLELPKGKYNCLIVSGDEAEDSGTIVSLPVQGTRTGGEVVSAGRYQCKILPLVHEADGEVIIHLEPVQGMKWKINAIFVNKEYLFL